MTSSKVNLTNSAWLERAREGEARIPVWPFSYSWSPLIGV